MPLRIVFFGDSICFGQGISPHKAWVTRLSAHLEALGHELGRAVTVANNSINGNTTRMALERMPYDVQSQNPHVLIIQFGMNDCNYWVTDKGVPRVSPAAFRANLQEIIERARKHDCRAIILNTNHPSTRQTLMTATDITYDGSNRVYNQIIREVAAENVSDTILNDNELFFLDKSGNQPDKLATFVLEDQLHLSTQGHDLYFEKIVPLIDGIVRRVARGESVV